MDAGEKIIKGKADAYNKILQTDDNRLTEDGKILIVIIRNTSNLFLVRTDINAVIGEVNLLLKGKLKQFRGLCEANVVCRMKTSFDFCDWKFYFRQNRIPENRYHSIVTSKVFGI